MSMDLNGLKRANDSYGHAAGDELICAAADCMKNSFNEYGKVYRVGGDEFVVIITEKTEQFEDIRHSFDIHVANWSGEFVDSMSVSYGWVFSTERNWNSVYEVSKAADKRMYESKERFITKVVDDSAGCSRRKTFISRKTRFFCVFYFIIKREVILLEVIKIIFYREGEII